MVAARAMVRDLFPVEENAKIFSLLMLVIGVSPIIAPTLGGYVTAYYGWQWVFIILAMMSAGILIAMHFQLPESKKPDLTVSFLPGPIIKGFLGVFRTPQFYTYAFTGAIASAGLYAYIAGSPFVFMELFHVSERQYGWIFAIIALGLIISSQLNSLVLRKYKSEQIIPVALFCQTLVGLTLLIGSYFHFIGLYATIFLILMFLSCQGFTFPNSSALSMAPFSRNAGTASALMGAIQLGIGAFTAFLVGVLSDNTPIPMTSVMFGCALTSFTVLLLGRKIINIKKTDLLAQEGAAEMISTI
jgi:DHA1 family bicyclomycin/chloramphenicol resistance-like MFS transporter